MLRMLRTQFLILCVVWTILLSFTVPFVAYGGGDYRQEQKTIVIENHVPADNSNGVIIAAVIAGVFTLAGTVVAVRKKS